MAEERIRSEHPQCITERLERIAAEFCNKYCKYPDMWDEKKRGWSFARAKYVSIAL